MKIWVQSASALGKNPIWKPYEKILTDYVKKIVNPGTSVDVFGVEVMSPATNWLRYAEFLNTSQIIDNALKAEKEGYDAFAVVCMDDPAFYELRQIVNIPVVSAGENSFHMACLLSPKFALLAYNPAPLRHQTENVKHYGLGERLVPSGSFGITLTELVEGFQNPEPILKGVRDVAKQAGEQGAAMLVPSCGCLNMLLVANNVREVAGIPVFDTVGAAVKMAELLVDLKKLGLERSPLGFYSRVAKEELTAIRKLYGAE